MRFNESWLIFFEGGGWCNSPEDCTFRAETKAGSSLHWPRNNQTISIGGLANRCCFCTRFCKFRRVFLKSCDGHSFVGDADIPVPPRADAPNAPSAQLRSNGQRIVRALIDDLIAHHGLEAAKSVLVAGCSAGGLAALLNAERIRDHLRERGVHPKRFKVAALSGIFFPPPRTPTLSTSFLSPFEEQMRAAARLGHMAIPPRCADKMAPGEAWRCLMGMEPVEALPADLPAFVYQSRLDLWQTNCVLAAGRSRYFQYNCSNSAWRSCIGWMQPKPGPRCSPDQWTALRAYEEANHASLVDAPALQRAGYGSFVHSCYDHCPATYGLINTGATVRPGAVNDSINMRNALFDWFLEDESARVPSWNHTHVGCWNGHVARGAGKPPPVWCRRQECGAVEKMHHESAHAFEATIRKRQWPWQLD